MTRSGGTGRYSITCWRVISETAMMAAAFAAYRGTRRRWLRRSTNFEAHGMTYQSRPWQTQTAGHGAVSGMEYLGLKSRSMS